MLAAADVGRAPIAIPGIDGSEYSVYRPPRDIMSLASVIASRDYCHF